MTDDVRFERPPVYEVALAVQFTTERALMSAELAALRSVLAADYPRLEEHPPLPRMIDGRSGGIEFGFTSGHTPPRFWFISEDLTHLVQVQADRLTVNWRRNDESPYPSYATIRPRLDEAWSQFVAHLSEVGAPAPEPDHAEATYVNPIEASQDTWAEPRQLGNVFTQWSGALSDSRTDIPESVQFTARYPIAGGGVLVASVEPATNSATNIAALMLTMTARRALDERTYEAAVEFLDNGHDAIVRTFASITTSRMHDYWGRRS